ncbi:hypothetical protein Goarm_003574 [Gossypium armourianum]|uniref:Uncharacterized protein n=1 Tax=Gossypium armourianum TaxID=34283 RepID=A0A7J9K3W2_9ROSI|nr:hypothetical protein [Gossypium armourianum]
MNLLPMTSNKKFANISSMHAPMDEDVHFAFPLRVVNLRSLQGIQEQVHVANQHMVYGISCSIPKP